MWSRREYGVPPIANDHIIGTRYALIRNAIVHSSSVVGQNLGQLGVKRAVDSMAIRIVEVEWVVADVAVGIEALGIIEVGNGVRLDEAAQFGVIVPGFVVVETGFLVQHLVGVEI